MVQFVVHFYHCCPAFAAPHQNFQHHSSVCSTQLSRLDFKLRNVRIPRLQQSTLSSHPIIQTILKADAFESASEKSSHQSPKPRLPQIYPIIAHPLVRAALTSKSPLDLCHPITQQHLMPTRRRTHQSCILGVKIDHTS